MPFEAGSLEDVEAWANAEFPDDLTGVFRCDLDIVSFDGEYTDGKLILQPILIVALFVGRTKNEHLVYARITGKSDVELVSEEKIDFSTDPSRVVRYMKPVVSLNNIDLTTPFRWVTETEHPAVVDQTEALIQYMFLKGGQKLAMQPRMAFFKIHFRAACRAASNGRFGIVEDRDANDNETLLAATTVFNQHVHAMDQTYQDFKIIMLRQLSATQDVDRENMAQLQSQYQDLERRLAVSETGRVKLVDELDVDRAKLKTALKEAQKWKTQFEGLKSTLQSALGQRY